MDPVQHSTSSGSNAFLNEEQCSDTLMTNSNL